MSEQMWDERYAAPDRVWSGRPNPWLVDFARQLPPGTAADLGCGEGADAIWLAQHGWSVTGVDFSAYGLARAAAEADRVGIEITWVRHDLATWRPERSFDLVSVHFFHAPQPQRDEVLRRAWALTARTLLVVAHDVTHAGGPPDEVKYGPQAVLAALKVGATDPHVQVAEVRSRDNARDTVVLLHR